MWPVLTEDDRYVTSLEAGEVDTRTGVFAYPSFSSPRLIVVTPAFVVTE